jgi:hypothetical protein
VFGRVDSVSVINGETWLNVVQPDGSERMLRPGDVQMVHEDFRQSMIWSQINNNVLNSQNISLIGRHIQGILEDGEGNAIGFIEGKVDYVDFSSSPPALIVGNDRVNPGNILSVADGPLVIGRSVNFTHEGQTNSAVIESVRVSGDSVSVALNFGGEEFIRPIDNVSFLTEALRLHQTQFPVTINGNTAPINNVTVNAGAVWISNGGVAVRFAEFRGAQSPATPPQNA